MQVKVQLGISWDNAILQTIQHLKVQASAVPGFELKPLETEEGKIMPDSFLMRMCHCF